MNDELFETERPNYASATFPPPRAFQETAHEALRQGAREGHRCQLVMAPTGAGKTYLGLRIAHEALVRGKSAVFVCDRTTLINQTSEAADGYGLAAHGVIQASHWRYAPSQPFQIASAQTLARRQWPDSDVVIVDEAHTQLATWVEHIQKCRGLVVGLSATPFSPGLGKLFSNLVNATTMDELTRLGVLVPMRVFSCTKVNMEGAATSGGEWTEGAAGERGMQIVGDVVMEWQKLASDRKTIVFGATIAHCEEMCRQFNEAGVMAAVFTSNTSATEREQLLREYTKPDSALRVLVSVEALAKGFDVKDVSCVVDCRPLRKSLSTAIQMWGRGLRASPATGKTDCLLLDHCIASGQRVLTDKGLVAIEAVTLGHKLWDGHEFVSHKGVVSRGIRPIIRYAGLAATADHPVKTAAGWRTLGQCADEQAAVVTTGAGGTTLWERDGHRTRGSMAGPAREARHACALRMRHLWQSISHRLRQFRGWADKGMQTLQPAAAGPGMAARAHCEYEASLRESEGSPVQGLWGPRDRVPFRLADHLRSLDRSEPGYPGELPGHGTGSEGERRPLRAGQHSVGVSRAQHEQHAGKQVVAADAQLPHGPSRSALCGCLAAFVHRIGAFIRGDRGEVGNAIGQTEGQVWDVLDCGPRNSFTCEGLLVHNSGNIVRFASDFEAIFFNGLDALDMGEKLDKAIRRDEDGEDGARACPQCKFKPFAKRCMACGFERQSTSLVEHEAGVMQEIRIGKQKLADDHRHLWGQIASYVRSNGNPDTQFGRAAHLFKDLCGKDIRDVRLPKFDHTQNEPLTSAVLNQIRARNIKFAKGKKAEARA